MLSNAFTHVIVEYAGILFDIPVWIIRLTISVYLQNILIKLTSEKVYRNFFNFVQNSVVFFYSECQ